MSDWVASTSSVTMRAGANRTISCWNKRRFPTDASVGSGCCATIGVPGRIDLPLLALPGRMRLARQLLACYEQNVKQRKKQPVVTRQAILESAGIGFANHGYAASGIGEIVARAGVTKGAVFHHFPDKEALALAWIRDVLAPGIGRDWIQPLADLQSLDGLKSYCRTRCLEMKAGEPLSTLVSLAGEISLAQPALGAELETLLASVRSSFAALLERGKSSAWIHRSIHPAAEAAFLVSVCCGFTVTTRFRDEAVVRANCATAVESYLDTLRPE